MTNRKRVPQRRSPAVILGIDGAGVTVKLQDRPSKVAMFGVRRKVDPGDVGEAEWKPATIISKTEVWLSSVSGRTGGGSLAQIAGRREQVGRALGLQAV